MPPDANSRYKFSLRVADPDGLLFLTPRRRFLFQELADSRPHTVVEGETLEALADRFFDGITDRPSGLYWIIGDFQLPPVLDASLELVPGSMLVIPSKRTARFVLSEARRRG